MRHQITLDYILAEGWLAPWIEALGKGEALASTCSACDTVQFPPLRSCPSCRGGSDGWRILPGGAEILHRTHGADGDFAMVRFDGATSATVAQSTDLPEGCTRAALAPSGEGPPMLRLRPEGRP